MTWKTAMLTLRIGYGLGMNWIWIMVIAMGNKFVYYLKLYFHFPPEIPFTLSHIDIYRLPRVR